MSLNLKAKIKISSENSNLLSQQIAQIVWKRMQHAAHLSSAAQHTQRIKDWEEKILIYNWQVT